MLECSRKVTIITSTHHKGVELISNFVIILTAQFSKATSNELTLQPKLASNS